MSEKNVSHTKWMKRAIFLASLGKNTTSPNPRVGAVIIDKNGNLISEGFHYKAGMPHAEAMAFNNLKKDALKTFCILLAPFAPLISEEIWHLIGFKNSVHLEHWPSFNAEALKEDSYEQVIQVNGKVRDKVNINNDMSEDQIKELTLKRPNILKWTQDKEIRKIIIVKGKIMNIVV